ncbi:hypothetical protein [Ferruginivarius sediminum]|uniref:Uncharacterized protein n=1 Tax=Ferruginivarius sediminum TaxID=2661937 RepID=A0A369TBV8_9PROT|nr:hypothetical protein [Ferruginivarius sediminum]RDD62004.1 hypothetical protein DRB17_09130 [Ferruginivarius sediminum]
MTSNRDDWTAPPAVWAEMAANWLHKQIEEARKWHDEEVRDGLKSSEPVGQRILELQVSEADADKLEHSLRELAAYLREAQQ